MKTFADLIRPVTPEAFSSRKAEPLHIPAAADRPKRELLTWAAFNALLSQTNLWDSDRLQMMHRAVDVPSEQYCQQKPSTHGPVWRPDPARVQLMLGAGASILANDVLTLHAPINAAGVALGEAFGAHVGASVFCSFKGAPVLNTHYDVHDVFAVQTEGEKLWNLYEGRVADPLDYPPGLTNADIERTRGRLVSTVTMRPGDALFVPRGVYHDAVALDAPSLHVSFTLMPLTGRSLLGLVEHLARDHPAFRAWLPSAETSPAAFTDRVAALAPVLAEIVASAEFREEAARRQRRAMPKAAAFALPERTALSLYRVTGRPFPQADAAGQRLHAWMTSQGRFALEDMRIQFDGDVPSEIDAVVQTAEHAGAVERL